MVYKGTLSFSLITKLLCLEDAKSLRGKYQHNNRINMRTVALMYVINVQTAETRLSLRGSSEVKWCPTCSLEARLTIFLFLCNRKPGLKDIPLAWPIVYWAAGVLSLWLDVLLKYSSVAKITYIVVQPNWPLFILQRFTL